MNVFISYAHADSDSARQLAAALSRAGIGVHLDQWQINPGDSWTDWLSNSLRTSDVVVLLASAAYLDSSWSQRELRELDLRGVELVIASLGETNLPPELSNRSMVDLSADFDAGVGQLVEQIRTTTMLDFASLSPQEFEELVVDLLRAMQFDVDRTRKAQPDSGFDAFAVHQRVNPSSSIENEIWLVEAKFYPKERASLQALSNFVAKITGREVTGGILITNGLLTSVVDDFRKHLERREAVQLRVWDGTEMKRLLRRFPDVAARHFGSETGAGAKP